MVAMEWRHHIIAVPAGFVVLVFNYEGIFQLLLKRKGFDPGSLLESKEDELPWPGLQEEIVGYFAGRAIQGDYPLIMDGYSSWALKILKITKSVPYGNTVTYKQVAQKAGAPAGARAAGQALRKNRTPLLIPCHRVVGYNNRLVGFGSGLDWKRELLNLEGIRIKK